MLERLTPVFRIACLVLAGIIFFQASRIFTRKDPIGSIKLPKISVITKAEAKSEASGSGKASGPADAKTSSAPSTNRISSAGTNTTTSVGTNNVASAQTTNAANKGSNSASANPAGINTSVIQAAPGMPPGMMAGPGGMPGGPRARGGPMMGMGRPGGPGGPANLPPEIKSRVEKIQQSEILGQVVRPMPMALIGIAGKQVFIRTANGQTGMANEGEDFGGVKIVKVGINRVLVEEAGEQKELTLFEGFGGETLISKGKENEK